MEPNDRIEITTFSCARGGRVSSALPWSVLRLCGADWSEADRPASEHFRVVNRVPRVRIPDLQHRRRHVRSF
jgi:hypothetical protein